ncbi:MAG TPA: hypothetical protein QGF58_19815 [Myxococcota bacterium]|nr:hypothetical protein [Myxococcota bacterium]
MLPPVMASGLIALWLYLSVAAAETVDVLLSVVGTRVVAASDVAFEEAYAAHDVSPLPPFEQATDWLLVVEDYRRLRVLAGDARLFHPPVASVDARLAAFSDSFDTREDYRAFLATWQLDEEALREHVYARMVVESYVGRALGEVDDPVTWDAAWQTWIANQREALPSKRLEAP